MKYELLHNPTVPVTYVLLTLQQAAERGVGREALLRGLDLPAASLEQPEARFSLLHYTQIIYRALQHTGDGSLGYEFALRSNLTAHGFFGYGLMSQRTLRDAVEFGMRFVQLCTPCYQLALYSEQGQAVIDVREAIPFGPLRQYGFDMFLPCFTRVLGQLEMPQGVAPEIWFDCPEPDYYARYRGQLLPARFDMGVNQIRFPESFLDQTIGTAHPQTAQLVLGQCERALQGLGLSGDFVSRVRALLAAEDGRYPNLGAVADRLFISSRTLKRRLQERGLNFQRLLDEIRYRDALRLLENPVLSLEVIAALLGYSSSANFTRAFRKWTGTPPGAFRQQRGRLAAAEPSLTQ